MGTAAVRTFPTLDLNGLLLGKHLNDTDVPILAVATQAVAYVAYCRLYRGNMLSFIPSAGKPRHAPQSRLTSHLVPCVHHRPPLQQQLYHLHPTPHARPVQGGFATL